MEILTTQQIIELLKKVDIFMGATLFDEHGDKDLEAIVNKIHMSHAKPGDIIFNQGDKGNSIILLLRGQVTVYVTDESGNEIHIATVEEKSFFGEMAIIDEADRMASVRAISDCLLGTIFTQDFWRYFYKYQVLAKNVLKGLNQRLRETDRSYIQRLAKEKEELIRFNQELERKVKEKTEQLRQKDLQLIEMDRIAGIGTLAAGIAHEINNPLGFVRSSVGFLKKSLDKMIQMTGYWDNKPFSEGLLKEYKNLLAQVNSEDLRGSLDKRFDRVNRGIERIMKIVNSLRSFSRLDMGTMGKINLNKTLEEAIELLSTEEVRDVQFIRDFQEVPPMECFPAEINQVLLHVLKNAVDALKGNGTITLTTSYNMAGDQISIQVTDNGRGMSPEVLRQAFNPFFTTKPVGSGTGVGLSLAERIIKRHGGKINISSKEGEGTTVTMTLPVLARGSGSSNDHRFSSELYDKDLLILTPSRKRN